MGEVLGGVGVDEEVAGVWEGLGDVFQDLGEEEAHVVRLGGEVTLARFKEVLHFRGGQAVNDEVPAISAELYLLDDEELVLLDGIIVGGTLKGRRATDDLWEG